MQNVLFCLHLVSFMFLQSMQRKLPKEDLAPVVDKNLEKILDQFKCTSHTCHGRGKCRLDDIGKAICDCYWQYYTGNRCQRATNACLKKHHKGVLPECAADPMTDHCASSYGVNNCLCHKDYFGAYFQNNF